MDDLKTEDLLTIQDMDDNTGGNAGNSSSTKEQTTKQRLENGENGRGVLEVCFVLLVCSSSKRFLSDISIPPQSSISVSHSKQHGKPQDLRSNSVY